MFKRVVNAFPTHFLGTATVVTFFLWLRTAADRGVPGEWWTEIFCAFGTFFGCIVAEVAIMGPRSRCGVPAGAGRDRLAREFSMLAYAFTGAAAVTFGYASVSFEAFAWTTAIGSTFNVIFLIITICGQRSVLLRNDADTQKLSYIWIGATMFGVIGLATQVYLVSAFGVSPWLCLVGLVPYAYVLRWVSLGIYGLFTRPRIYVES
jgi:hypothetical protein